MLRLFAVLLFPVSNVFAHINRMECSYDANFTIMDTNKYCGGTISKTVHNVNKTECVIYCFTHDECAFVNFKLDETECQLMTADQSGTYSNKVGWEFLSTDYRTIRIGSICRHRDACGVRFCFDDCESDEQYVCDEDEYSENIAEGKTVVDDTGVTHAEATNGITDRKMAYNVAWIRVDLGLTYTIEYLVLSILTEEKFSISIGNQSHDPNENALCIKVLLGKMNMVLFCESVVPGQVMKMSGRYFFMYSDVTYAEINVKEISIYAMK